MEFWCHMLSGWQVCDWSTQYHLCSTCEGWRLSGCCGSVAEHWQLKPEVSWVWATAGLFTCCLKFLYFSSVRQDALSSMEKRKKTGPISKVAVLEHQQNTSKLQQKNFETFTSVVLCPCMNNITLKKRKEKYSEWMDEWMNEWMNECWESHMSACTCLVSQARHTLLWM